MYFIFTFIACVILMLIVRFPFSGLFSRVLRVFAGAAVDFDPDARKTTLLSGVRNGSIYWPELC